MLFRSWTDEAMSGAGFSGGWSQLRVGYRAPSNAMRLAGDFANGFLPPESRDLPEADQGSFELYESTVTWLQCDQHHAVKTCVDAVLAIRSDEHTYELQSLMRTSD